MSSPSNNPAPASRPRLLLVDDEEIVLVSLRETLRREGYDIVTAGNALQGLEALSQGPFAAVLSDQQMPYMTGLEFLSRVKGIQPTATRILITAVLSLETVVDAINKGEIYRFIIKPWLREELLATVKNAVQRYELLCQHAQREAQTEAANQQLADANRLLQEQLTRVQDDHKQLRARIESLEASLSSAVRLAVQVLESFQPDVGAQARRVNELCGLFADTLELPASERQALELSAWVYDVGLIGFPAGLIERWQNDTASINTHERALIEQHPARGQELLTATGPLAMAGKIIRAHHERYDGTGYPDHLAGDAIPWLGRLLAVAVSYAAAKGGPAENLAQIRAGSGSAFDPEAVRVLLRVMPKLKPQRAQREVLLSELRPGMVPARGIYTAEGILLAPEGQPLSAPAIDHLVQMNQVQPIRESLVIYG